MDLALLAFNQIAIMFMIIIIGMICYKTKLIDEHTNKGMADLLLMLVNPLLIFISYQREFQPSLLTGLMISFVLAIVIHGTGILLSYILLRKKHHEASVAIERFAVIYSNCGFIGIPLTYGIFGSEGVFYITAYNTIFNLVVWTHGMITISGKSDRKAITEALLSPSVLSTVAGFVLFMCRISLPHVINQTLTYVANMNTALAMLIAGVTFAQTDFKKLLQKGRIYYITIIKLIILPVTMLLLFRVFDIPNMVMLTAVIAAACPTAASINLFALRYNNNPLYASELFAMSTMFSLISIPLVMILANLLT